LPKETVLVVGLGEVGRPLFELLDESGKFIVFGFDTDKSKMQSLRQTTLPNKVDIIHICLPCSNKSKFVDIVTSYIGKFEPKLVIVNSTVPLKTTIGIHEKCSNCLVAHSPVRGVHKNPEYMKWELKRWTKYVGGANAEAADAARNHFEKLGLKTKVLKSCAETELAKLFETTYRAWMIACFQEMHRISNQVGADFADVVDFIEDTHRIRSDRPVMFPDVISGHCLIPNVELLLESYDSKLLRLILDSNEKRKEEVKDKRILEEVERIKRKLKEHSQS
jgi:UDP-N-acetyl-D-mannosaminuronate dehydrogenase